jgi:hypothetical protein
MVAQFGSETFAPTFHTPGPICSDPDDVRLALETARAFQGMGKLCDAVEWLESAAERAAQAGQHERAVVLLQAMAGLTKRSAPSPRFASGPCPPRLDVRDRGSVRPPPTKLPPCPPPLHAGVSSLPPPTRTSSLLPPPRKSLPPRAGKSSLPPVPMLSLPPPPATTSLPRDGSLPQGPRRASVAPKRSSLVMAPATPARASSHAKTIRVAIAGFVPELGSFTIEQLSKGQPLPAGTMEATLTVFDDERMIKVVMRRPSARH